MPEQPEWTPLVKAARLAGISPAKLSNMVKQTDKYGLATKRDPRDERKLLVDLAQLRKVLGLEE